MFSVILRNVVSNLFRCYSVICTNWSIPYTTFKRGIRFCKSNLNGTICLCGYFVSKHVNTCVAMINTNTIYEGKSTSGKATSMTLFDYFKKLLCTQHQCAFCKEHHIDADTLLGMGLSDKIHTAMNLHTKDGLDGACCMWLASSPFTVIKHWVCLQQTLTFVPF